jgi:arabinofuranosyltransferase
MIECSINEKLMNRSRTVAAWMLILLLYGANLWLLRGFNVDDSYITFRYVQQWNQGHGLVYNIGDSVEGYSNFLWVVALAPFDRLGADLNVAAKALGATLGLLTLFMTWRMTRRLSLRPIAPLLLAASGPFAAWMVSGLETPLFIFVLTFAAYAFIREEDRRCGWLSGLLFAMLALTRPDGMIFAFTAILLRSWKLLRAHTSPERHDWMRLLIFAGVVSAYCVWRISYYGYLLPNTVYAKSLGLQPRAILEGFYYLYTSLAVLGGFFFLAVPTALAVWGTPRSHQVEYLALSIGMYALFLVAGGGDWMPLQRFAVHVLPFIMLLVHTGLIRLTEVWHVPRAKTIVVLLVLGQMVYSLAFTLDARFVQHVSSDSITVTDSPTTTYLRRHVRPTDTVAVVDAGLIALRLPLEVTVVDMVGLTDAHIAHQPVQLPGGLFGRGDAYGKWDVDYVLARKPRFVQVNITGPITDSEWQTNFTGTNLLVNDPRFRAAYNMVPDVNGLFIRRDDPE